MSVRFSLRFAGRSWGRLLGVPNWPEAGRWSVVAIIVGVYVVVFVYSYNAYLQVPAVFLKLAPQSRNFTRSQLLDSNPESLDKPPAPQIVGVGQRLRDSHCLLHTIQI